MKIKKSIIVFGWILIFYFVYCDIVPSVWLIAKVITQGMSTLSSGPIGIWYVLKEPTPSIWLMNLHMINRFILGGLSIASLIGGIAVLKLKKWSRKFIVIAFSIGIVSALVHFFITLSHLFFWKHIFPRKIDLVFLGLFLGLYIVIVIFFTRPKVKEEFR